MKITLKELLTSQDKAILLATFACIFASIFIVAYASLTGYVPTNIAYNMLVADSLGIAVLLMCLGYQANRALKLSKN